MIRLVLGGEKSGKSDMAYGLFLRAFKGLPDQDPVPEPGTASARSAFPEPASPVDCGLANLHSSMPPECASQGARRCPGMILAMGLARDAGFRRQILTHRLRRNPAVPLVEPGLELAHALDAARGKNAPVLVDSLDFWVFACMEAGQERADQLLSSLLDWSGPQAPECVLVSCEVGLGPLAATAFTRRFVRSLGHLNQRLAQAADEVQLAVAGLSLTLKGNGNGLI